MCVLIKMISANQIIEQHCMLVPYLMYACAFQCVCIILKIYLFEKHFGRPKLGLLWTCSAYEQVIDTGFMVLKKCIIIIIINYTRVAFTQ